MPKIGDIVSQAMEDSTESDPCLRGFTYHEPNIHCTPTKQEASKMPWKKRMAMIW